jgi:nicotinamidase-related amidase
VPPLSGSIPYPWPFDASLDEPLGSDRLALLCIAVQPSFVAATVGADVTVMTISLAARALRNAGARVVAVTVGASAGGRRAAVSTFDAETVEPLIAASADAVVTTVGLDGFYASPLEPLLRSWGCDRLALCGLGAETAVDCTLRSANDRGFECLTLTDAVAPHDPVLAARAHHSVTMSGGIFGVIGTTADLLIAMDLGGVPAGLESIRVPIDSRLSDPKEIVSR